MMRGSGAASIVITFIFILPALAVPVAADGMSMVRYTTSGEAWGHASERSQFAIINYADGYEKMIISIQVGQSELELGSELFWLFPIPSKPSDVKVNISSNVPRIEGGPMGANLKKDVANDKLWLICTASQFYSAPLALFAMLIGMGSTGGTGVGTNYSATAYQIAEKYGLTSVVLSATDAEGLQFYFDSIGLSIPDGDLSLVTEYINSGFSFVATRISDLDSFRQSAKSWNGAYILGVEVCFPSDQIFFPLELTSVYGAADIPITVEVIDSCSISRSPPQNASLKITANYSAVDGEFLIWGYPPYYYGYPGYYGYQMAGSGGDKELLLDFFSEQIGANWREKPNRDYYSIKDPKMTTVTIEGKAYALTEDLWMADSPPMPVALGNFMVENPWSVVGFIFTLVSMAAGLIAGLLLDRKVKHIPHYLLVGIANNLTVLASIALFNEFQDRWKEKEESPFDEYGPPKKRSRFRAGLRFFAIFSPTFLSLLFLSWYIIAV